MDRYTESLLARADAHWSAGDVLPIDLFAEMVGEGINVEALEPRHLQQPE